MNSRTSPGVLTVTKALTTDSGVVLPGGEAVASETHRKTENLTAVPRDGTVTPARETVPFGKHTAVLAGQTESPGENTMIPMGHPSVTP